jgi:hypothetical protein
MGGAWDERDIGNYGTVKEMAGGNGRRLSDKGEAFVGRVHCGR